MVTDESHSTKMSSSIQIVIIALMIPVIISQFIGPATIKLHRMEKCAEDDPNVNVTILLNKINRTHVGINVYIETPYDFDENIGINASFSKWGDGGWKPHVLDIAESNACEFFMKYADDKFKYLLGTQNRPPKCPVTKGKFDVKNYIYDGVLSVPLMYGEFMVDVLLIMGGKQLTCVKIYANSSPAKSFG